MTDVTLEDLMDGPLNTSLALAAFRKDSRSEVILARMTYRVGPKGQVVIPKSMRDRLGIAPGDEVDFTLDGTAVRVEPVREQASLRGTLAGRGLLSELEADHRAERDR